MWIHRTFIAFSAVLLAGCTSLGQEGGPLDSLIQIEPRSQSTSPSQFDGIRDRGESFSGIEQKGTGKFTSEISSGDGVINDVTDAPTESGADGVAINLLNVPLADAAKTILGDILKVNYTIADKLTANITIQSSAPMQKSALIDVFESALKVNGMVLIRGNDNYRIVQDAQSARANASVAVTARTSGPGVQVTVVPLKFVSPSEMKRIIDPVLANDGLLNVDDDRNLLVLAGTASEMSNVRRLIDHFDVDWMRGMSFAFYPVKSSDPDALASELESVMGLDRNGPLRGSLRIIPNRRLSSIMVISTRPAHLKTARDWIIKLDRVAETNEVQLFVYKVRNRSAGELASVVTDILGEETTDSSGGSGGSVGPRFNRVSESIEPTTSSMGASTAQLPASTQTAPLAAQSASATTPVSRQELPPAQDAGSDQPQLIPAQHAGASFVKVVADEPNSALLINSTRKEYERIVRILERIDVLPTQVMIEALVAEVTLTDELKFGVKWAFTNGLLSKGGVFSDNDDGTISSNFPGFSYFYFVKNIRLAIDALSSITKVKIVSAPSLTVLDNRKATLQVGDQVPIVTQSAQSNQNPDAPTVNQVVMKDTGVILGFSPHVSSSGRVVLDIEQEVSSASRTETSGIDSPTISQRRIKTTVVVGDGQTVALGGLIQESDGVTKSQIPILGDIPVLGAAFRQKDDTFKRTELVIFVRPLVLRDSNAAGEVTDEFIRRLDKEPLTSMSGRDNYDRDARRILR